MLGHPWDKEDKAASERVVQLARFSTVKLEHSTESSLTPAWVCRCAWGCVSVCLYMYVTHVQSKYAYTNMVVLCTENIQTCTDTHSIQRAACGVDDGVYARAMWLAPPILPSSFLCTRGSYLHSLSLFLSLCLSMCSDIPKSVTALQASSASSCRDCPRPWDIVLRVVSCVGCAKVCESVRLHQCVAV